MSQEGDLSTAKPPEFFQQTLNIFFASSLLQMFGHDLSFVPVFSFP